MGSTSDRHVQMDFPANEDSYSTKGYIPVKFSELLLLDIPSPDQSKI